ncbi:microtubule-actin cross-linking factor 1, isoforms 6/7-like [Brachyistius frenatus]|uniref:microtubule-actin cross-linking factor 1, isoforms 6/7-like n=1 Tax=Brachyistius frenatus TaxID=100188 RepID=UPI0037E8A5D4
MGKPLSRPDCLRQNPRCLGKGDEDEAYIEDCYVPQRSIYDTMRINEQIDQGTKLCQPSRSTLGSGGEVRGEGSTLSSNGTIGADLGGVFVPRNADNPGGVRKLDERVIFDALKLTGDPQIMSPPVGIVGSGLPIAPSSSGGGGVAAVAKRRHQGGDKKDNPNRRSWKAFMPPSYPEFAERLEFSFVEGAEKRLSGVGIPLSPLQALPPHLPPSTPTSSTPSLPPYTPSPLSSAPHTPPVSTSPSLTPTVTLVPPLLQHPLGRQKQLHPVLQKRQNHAVASPSKESLPAFSQTRAAPQVSGNTPQQSPGASRQVDRKREEHRQTSSFSKAGIRQIPEELVESVKTSDSERDSPLSDHDQGDSAPLIPPKPVFCPPTKARTWPRSITTGKRTQVGLRHNFPVLPPLPPLLGEDNGTDEESLYLLDPPSPFLKDEEALVYGGLPLSPCISQEGGDEGLLGWGAQGGELRERSASELKFEEDERKILEELEDEVHEECREIIEEGGRGGGGGGVEKRKG